NDRMKIPQNEESNSGDKFPTCSPPQHNPDQMTSSDPFSRKSTSDLSDLNKNRLNQPNQQEINLSPLIPGPASATFLDDCCFKLFQRPINKNVFTSYYLTGPPRCLLTAAILKTKRSYHICVDPNQPWVKRILNFLEKRSF
ncbi:hypothetical protein GOODEAATRI_023515, partial [Goodea atripinnis]